MLQLLALVTQDSDPDSYAPDGQLTEVVKRRFERITAHVFNQGPAHPDDSELIAHLHTDPLVRHLSQLKYRTVKLIDRNGTYALFLETSLHGTHL